MTTKTPYFITEDLEVTARLPTDALTEVRMRTNKALVRAFGDGSSCTRIAHSTGVAFFTESREEQEFVISADGGIYIDSPDAVVDSTRMYASEADVVEGSKAYSIVSRSGASLDYKTSITIPPEKLSDVGLYDDGIFSGDTLRTVLACLPNGSTRYKVNVLLNFSGAHEIAGAPINAYYTGLCRDWIDERDFYYGVKNSGASINPGGIVSGVPYISHPAIATKKASIQRERSKEFCCNMIDINRLLWRLIDENIVLGDIPRLAYLLGRYPQNTPMQEVLLREKSLIEKVS